MAMLNRPLTASFAVLGRVPQRGFLRHTFGGFVRFFIGLPTPLPLLAMGLCFTASERSRHSAEPPPVFFPLTGFFSPSCDAVGCRRAVDRHAVSFKDFVLKQGPQSVTLACTIVIYVQSFPRHLFDSPSPLWRGSASQDFLSPVLRAETRFFVTRGVSERTRQGDQLKSPSSSPFLFL